MAAVKGYSDKISIPNCFKLLYLMTIVFTFVGVNSNKETKDIDVVLSVKELLGMIEQDVDTGPGETARGARQITLEDVAGKVAVVVPKL